MLGSLSPRHRVWPAPCSCDNPHLLQKGDLVLWHRAWGWGRQKQSTIQPYNQGDFPKLHVHICYKLSKQKNLLNLWSSQKSQLADTQIIFACPITQLISFPVCWFTLTGGMSTLPHQLLCSQGQSCVGVSVVGELHLTRSEEQTLKAQVHDEPRQVTSWLLSLTRACSILPYFLGTAVVFLHKSIQR